MKSYGIQHYGLRSGVPSVFMDGEDFTDVFETARKLTEKVPDEDWTNIDLVITDYELSEQNQKNYIELFNILSREGNTYVTIQTNGQTKLQEEFDNYLQRWSGELVFACQTDPNIPRRGDIEDHLDIVAGYNSVANSNLFFWFSIGTDEDEEYVQEIVSLYKSKGIDVPIYVSPYNVEDNDTQEIINRTVYEIALRNRFRYSSTT